MKIPELSWPTATQPYDDDLLLGIQTGSVVLLIRGRNAWHSTWVRHYLKNSTLYTDVPSAKRGAEGQRGPGNVFYIVEAPAVLLRGERSNVVLCDAHPDNPFGAFKGLEATVNQSLRGAWIDGLFPGISVQDAVAAFRPYSGHWSGPTPSEHSLRTGRLETTESFDTKRHPLQSLVSRPVGSNYYLQWDANPRGNRYTRRGANALAKGWAQRVAEATKGNAQPVRAKQLQRHRDDVLKAKPKSQWLAEKAQADAKKREAREAAFELWSEASDRVSELEDALWRAEAERDSARTERMTPASTSAGVRKQRERYEVAAAELERLTKELAQAEVEAENLWTIYTTES